MKVFFFIEFLFLNYLQMLLNRQATSQVEGSLLMLFSLLEDTYSAKQAKNKCKDNDRDKALSVKNGSIF